VSTIASSVRLIADLHLDPTRPAATRLFLALLTEQPAPTALYILGDLFETWIGDDDDQPLGEQVAAGLRDLAGRGCALYFIHGNRDFLLGEDFARRSHLRLLPEHTVIDLHGTPTLIMHGDTLCTDDVAYQALRRQIRAPDWQATVLAQPLAARRQLAASLRSESERALRDKPEAITDVNPDTVRDIMQQHGVRQLIHGHTHRPGCHDLVVDGRPARRLVLGAWYHGGSVLSCDTRGCRLLQRPAPAP